MTYDEFRALLGKLDEAEQEHEARCQEHMEEPDDHSCRRMLAAYRRMATLQEQIDTDLAEKESDR